MLMYTSAVTVCTDQSTAGQPHWLYQFTVPVDDAHMHLSSMNHVVHLCLGEPAQVHMPAALQYSGTRCTSSNTFDSA